MSTPIFRKPKCVTGNHLIFRNAKRDDAAFILSLRLDARKSLHLSKTSADLSQQIAWLDRYETDESQVYFIISDRHGQNVGTVRLYDAQRESFCWGSWIIKDGCPNNYSIESALIVYEYALHLGFEKAHFDVRKGNISVWKFHEKFGATKISENDIDYFYQISFDCINRSMDRYKKFLPEGIEIEY